jgi:hypothetical protein
MLLKEEMFKLFIQTPIQRGTLTGVFCVGGGGQPC